MESLGLSRLYPPIFLIWKQREFINLDIKKNKQRIIYERTNGHDDMHDRYNVICDCHRHCDYHPNIFTGENVKGDSPN